MSFKMKTRYEDMSVEQKGRKRGHINTIRVLMALKEKKKMENPPKANPGIMVRTLEFYHKKLKEYENEKNAEIKAFTDTLARLNSYNKRMGTSFKIKDLKEWIEKEKKKNDDRDNR